MKYSVNVDSESPGYRCAASVPIPMLALAGGLLASYLPMILPAAMGASFLGWMPPLAVALVHLLTNIGRMTFDHALGFLDRLGHRLHGHGGSGQCIAARHHAADAFLVVGAAFSTLRTTPELPDRIDRWIT
ncbi:MAG: hypothetical protein IPO95_16555, partial [Rhodanobacteraceae bacterium]|nr:hypothetical protein [Rhodanobacteraceae bacterium]